jgi:hypothetical protein
VSSAALMRTIRGWLAVAVILQFSVQGIGASGLTLAGWANPAATCCCGKPGSAGECPMCRRARESAICCRCAVQDKLPSVAPRMARDVIAIQPRVALLPVEQPRAAAPARTTQDVSEFTPIPPTPPPKV